MKTLKTILLGSLALLFVAACQNEEIDQQSPTKPIPGVGETVVSFDLDATAIPMQGVEGTTRTYTPTYSKNNFKIYAFKKDAAGDFKFEKTVDVAGMSLANNKLTGYDVVRVGVYKFLATYGTEQAAVNKQTWTSFAAGNMELKDSGKLTTEIFLQTDQSLSTLKEYDFKISNPAAENEKVTATLKRAVSRVDIVFISAKKKVTGGYFEQSYKGKYPDILGGYNVAIDIKFNNLTWNMDYFGTPGANANAAKPYTLALNDLTRGTGTNKKVTIGTYKWAGDPDPRDEQSPIFRDGYLKFDNVQPADIRENGAHIFGPYLFPNASTHADISKIESLVIKGTDSANEVTARTIPINAPFRVEQNKVTLIKVYVLQAGDPVDPTPPGPGPDPNDPTPDPEDPDPPMVFETNVEFEVEIETVWNGSNSVEAEIN